MKIINKMNNELFAIKGFFDKKEPNSSNLIKENGWLTEYPDKNLGYFALGKEKDYNKETLKGYVAKIVSLHTRKYLIDAETFVNKNVSLEDVIRIFTDKEIYLNNKFYSQKTKKEKNKSNFTLFFKDEKLNKVFEDTKVVAELVNVARKYQATPPNIANSEWLAEEYKELFKDVKNKNLKIKILNKKNIEKENMGLFLSVNRGSSYEPRLVVIEYTGNPESEEKIALVGKGITFDSGGYNLKPSQAMAGMKYDMSGSAIIASAMRGIVHFEPKVNVVAVLPLTDNKISSGAQTPDSIWKSMNGKSVEVNNTDAEGRLILADGITYAIRNLSATKIVDVATLTGAMVVALGSTFTGTWATKDSDWNDFKNASDQSGELLWRMPFHNDFSQYIKKSNFADLKNTDMTGKGGSISAAMFLKEFVENKDYIHFDIAGTGGDGENPKGTLVKTLISYIVNKGN